MSRPTIIMPAPNGARKVKTDHPQLPVSIDETIAAAKACHAEGASILHAHVRGDQNEHVLDVARYKTLLAGLREQVPDMLVQVTTEAVGIYSPQQQYDDIDLLGVELDEPAVLENKTNDMGLGFDREVNLAGGSSGQPSRLSIPLSRLLQEVHFRDGTRV